MVSSTYCVEFLFCLSCVPYVAIFSGLSISYCSSVFSKVYLSCVPYVSNFSGLSISYCPFGILWIVHLSLPFRYSLDCPFLIAPSVFSGLSIYHCPFGILWIVHFLFPFGIPWIVHSVFSNVYLYESYHVVFTEIRIRGL